MEAAEILEQAKVGSDTPHGWIVLPLLHRKLIVGILGWIFGIILGFGLFVMVAFATIPVDFQSGAFPALFSAFFLALLLFVGLGSAWSLFVDVKRLRSIDEHMIVLTPEDFFKQEGKKIIHVPLSSVRYVTARGRRPPDRTPEREAMPRSKDNVVGFLVGRGLASSNENWRRRRMRTPTSLAFIDTRTDAEVTVVNDTSYGDPFMIAALLKEYAASVQSLV